MKHAPLTKQRSEWREHPGPHTEAIAYNLTAMGAYDVRVLTRNVHDGWLDVIVADEPAGWHLSICHVKASERALPRYPTWDEIAHARYGLVPDDVDMVMHLPPPDEFVALHDTTFHLHEVES